MKAIDLKIGDKFTYKNNYLTIENPVTFTVVSKENAGAHPADHYTNGGDYVFARFNVGATDDPRKTPKPKSYFRNQTICIRTDVDVEIFIDG